MKPKNPSLRSALFTTFCVAVTLPAAVHAATWDGAPDASGSSADANWSTATNWVGDLAPAATDPLSFDGSVQTTNVNDYAANTQFNGLTFEPGAGAFTISGNNVLMAGPISNISANDQDLSAVNFNIQSNQTIYVEDATTMTLGDIWSEVSNTARYQTKTGAGTLVLTPDGTAGAGRSSGDYTHYIVNDGTMVLDANSTENRQTVDSVTVNEFGTLKLGAGARTPTNSFTGLLYSNAVINIGGTFDLNGHQGIDARVQELSGTGGLVTSTSSADSHLIIASRNNATVTFPGIIEDGSAGGSTGIEIDFGGSNGGRVNVFTGTNTYSGDTLVSDQNLVINGDQSGCAGDVLVPSADTARLGGYGIIGGNVSIGCIICPGDASGVNAQIQSPGTLTILGSLSFEPNLTFTKYEDGVIRGGFRQQEYDFDVTDWGAGLTPGTEYDTIVAGSLNINSDSTYKLNINVNFSGDSLTNFDDTAQSFTLVSTTGGVTGLTTDNWQVNLAGLAVAGIWDLQVVGNDLVLSYTPADVTADVVWDGGGTDDLVSTAANWVGDTAPMYGQSVGFAGSTRTSPVNDFSLESSFMLTSDILISDPIVLVADTTGIAVGQTVTGVGIPADTTVVSVDSATSFTMSNAATATDPAAELTFTSIDNAQVGGIAFLSGAASFTLSGDPLNLGDAVEFSNRVVNDSVNPQSIELDLKINNHSNQIWAKSGDIDISGSLSSVVNANRTIASLGSNTTTLSGTIDNAYLQAEALEGTLVLGKDSSATVHAVNNVVMSVAATGTVQLGGTGGDQIAGSITMNGGFFDLNGLDETVANLNSDNTSTGVITNNLAATTSTLTVSGTNGNDSQTIADGLGTVAMVYNSGATTTTTINADNSYSGGTTITGGIVRIHRNTPLGSGPVTFIGDTAANSTVFIPSNGSQYTGGPFSSDLIVAASNKGRVRWGRAINVTGTLTGAGVLEVAHENRNGQGTTVTGDWSAFTGTVLLRGGDAFEATTNFTHFTLSPSGLPLARLTMQTDYVNSPSDEAGTNKHLRILANNGTVAIGDLNSDGNMVPGSLDAYNHTAGTGTFEIGGLGLTSSFDGNIRDGNASNITALTKVGGGTWTLTNVASSYSGPTAVNAGTLSIVHDLANGASVSVATGAVLNLAVANDVVDSLWLDGAQVVNPGTYGPVGSAATYQSAHFTGTGYLNVTNGGAASGYSTWAAANAGGQTPGEDFDNDGTENGIEYFMNAAAGFTANPGLVGGSITWPNGGNITPDQYGTQYVVQTSTNLSTWTDVLAGDLDVNNASTLTYMVPTGPTKNFVRLVVNPN